MGGVRMARLTMSAVVVSIIILELVIVASNVEGSDAYYGSRRNSNREFNTNGHGHSHLSRPTNRRLRSSRTTRRPSHHRNSKNGRGSGRNHYELDHDYDLTDYRLLKRNDGEFESVESCCPTVFELIEPLHGKNRSGHSVELYQDENVRQRFYEVSCQQNVLEKPCKFLDGRHSKASQCVQQYSYTYALVRPPGSFLGDQPWSLDYIHIRSGCACQVISPLSIRRRKKLRS